MENIKMFIQRLEELMQEKEISEHKLTQELNLSKSSVWNWKQGSQPGADKILLIANYFEVSTDYLLGRSNDLGIIQTNANLKPDEAELITLYKKLSFQNKNQLIGFAKALAY